MKLAANIDQIFGKVTPPPGPIGIYQDPVVGLGRFIIVCIQLSLIVGALFCMIYLLWGGIDWIGSGDDKEALKKAQTRMRNAFVGSIMLVVALVMFVVISGNILHIIEPVGGGFEFKLPRF